MRRRATLLAALALAGCGHLPFAHRAPPRGGETITYARRVVPTIAALGSGYVITLGPDGQGILTTGRGDAALDRRFQASAGQVTAFAGALRRFRPRGERLIPAPGRACRTAMTDADIVDIRWQGSEGTADHLSVDEGCDPARHRKLVAALRAAPALLPVADLLDHR